MNVYEEKMSEQDWIDQLPSSWRIYRRFGEYLVKTQRVKKIVELGAEIGCSLFIFAKAGVEKVYAVDVWDKENEDENSFGYHFLTQKIQENNFQNIELIEGYYVDIGKKWNHGAIDVLHIHSTDSWEHLECWLPHITLNTIILVRDVLHNTDLFNAIPCHKCWFPFCSGLGILCFNEWVLKEIFNDNEDTYMGNIATVII